MINALIFNTGLMMLPTLHYKKNRFAPLQFLTPPSVTILHPGTGPGLAVYQFRESDYALSCQGCIQALNNSVNIYIFFLTDFFFFDKVIPVIQ